MQAINRTRAMPSGVSPRQLAVASIGGLAGIAALICSGMGWNFGRDFGVVGLLVSVLIALLMALRSISIKATSIRRDILRQGQRQLAVTSRVEANTGLAVPRGLNRADAPQIGSSLEYSGRYFGIGPEYEYAWRAAQNPSALETFALRTKSVKMRDAFARWATGMQFGYTDVVRMARSSRAVPLDGIAGVVAGWNSKGLLALARVVANQRIRVDDASTAVLLFQLCVQVFGLKALGKTDRALFLEALVDVGLAKDARQLIHEIRLNNLDPIQASLLEANLCLCEAAPDQGRNGWLKLTNKVLESDGAGLVSLMPGTSSPLDRLFVPSVSSSQEKFKNAPLVSVIVPTHNGSELIDTALRSLQEQTWENIEILVVDDCSNEHHVQRLRELCSLYGNVKLFELDQNRGAYVARNYALQYASGEFLTVHDDDDWSHPEKIQRQVVHLLKSPQAVANMSMHSRVTEELRFIRVNNNTKFVQPNYSSIMVRRSALKEIGVWDTVNRGADAEFRDRINSIYGTRVEVVGNVPMSFTRTRIGSLTHGELDRGYIEPARLVYLESYTRAHQLGIYAGRREQREFAVPLDLLPDSRGQHKGEFDVVFATDFRFPGGTTTLTIQEIGSAFEQGLRVGVLQLDSPLNKPGSPLSSSLLDLLFRGSASLLRLADQYHSKALIIRHPSVVQFLDNMTSPAEIDQCLLIANTAPVIAGGSGSVYDLEDCARNISQCFSIDVTVVPESGVTRRLVKEVSGTTQLSDYDWPGFIPVLPEIRRRVQERRPVVGRHSRDNRMKWPDKLVDFVDAYYQPEIFRTHVLGGMDSIAASIPQDVRDGLSVSPFGSEDVRTYLSRLDFWVYFHSEATVESFGMAAAEAMEAGLVVILPHYMQATFGDGAIYAEPREVGTVIQRYWNDRELYVRQSEHARSYVKNHYSETAYETRLQGILLSCETKCITGKHVYSDLPGPLTPIA